MRKKKTIIILCIIVASGVFGLLKLNKDFLLLWNANNIRVGTEKPLDKKQVKIEYGLSVNTINRETDEDLFKDREKYDVLFNGKPQEKLINEYGENDFLITYGNKYYLSFRQFKLNRRHQHDYHFKFYEKQDTIFVKVNIRGKDWMKFERPMLEISQANKYCCNTPIDSTKVLYNGIELKPLKSKSTQNPISN